MEGSRPLGALKDIPWSCRSSGAGRLISAYILARVTERPYKHDKNTKIEHVKQRGDRSPVRVFTFGTHTLLVLVQATAACGRGWILMCPKTGASLLHGAAEGSFASS